MAQCCLEQSESRQRKPQNMSFKALALNAHYAGEKTAASEGSNTLRDELSEHWKWTGQRAGSGQKCKKEKLTVTWQLLRSCGKGPILTPKKLGAENSKLGMNQWSLFYCFFCLWSVYKIQMAYWEWIVWFTNELTDMFQGGVVYKVYLVFGACGSMNGIHPTQ